MLNDQPLQKEDANGYVYLWWTLAITGILIVLAIIVGNIFQGSENNLHALYLAALIGGLGGLVHEFAQSGGKILFITKMEDGVYLGSLSGVVLGMVAGVLVARVLFSDPPTTMGAAELSYEAFIAGIGLKGITEAAGGQAVPSTKPQAKSPNPPTLPPVPPQAP